MHRRAASNELKHELVELVVLHAAARFRSVEEHEDEHRPRIAFIEAAVPRFNETIEQHGTEVVQFLVENGADINARDFRGRTPYRTAEGAKQSFQFQSWPETADLLKNLGADTRLGIPGTVQERLRDIPAERPHRSTVMCSGEAPAPPYDTSMKIGFE